MATKSTHDVAAYLLKNYGPMSAMKLQKLLYYSQAWSLVWDEEMLFEERIEAWSNGPVIPKIYEGHRGQFKLESWSQGNPENLSQDQKETVDAVWKFYGGRSAQWLSDLTHQEDPWINARKGLKDDERGNAVITHAALAEYYSALP